MLPAFFHQTPFFRLLLPFVAGIVVGFVFYIPAGFCISICVISLMALIVFVWKRRRWFPKKWGWLYGLSLNVFLFSAGVSAVELQSFTPNNNSEQGVWLVVVSEPLTERANSFKTQALVKTDITNGSTTAHSEMLLVYFRKDSLARTIQQGDLLMINTILNPVKNAGNPYEFDYQGYLARKHISRSAFVEIGNWQKLDSYAQSPLLNLSNRIRNELLAVLKRAGLSGNEMAVASALLLGYRSDLDDEIRRAYSASGAMHILAVSGLHVGIVYCSFIMLLKLLPFVYRSRWLRAVLSLSFVWLFALITGLSPSVMRAATMFSFIAIGEAMERNVYTYNSIAASAFILLLINPNNLFEVSFQFSYMAVIAIVYIYKYLKDILSFKNRLLNQGWDLICVSIAAQIGSAPLALYYFKQFPSYFILANFVGIPAATVIIYAAMILFILSPIPLLLKTIGWLLDKFIFFVNSAIFFIEKMPGSVITEIRFDSWEIIVAYSLVAASTIWLLAKRKKALFVSIMILMLWIAGATIRTGNDLRRQQLIVYNSQGNSLIQFIEGYNYANFYAVRNPLFNVSDFIYNQRTAMQLKEGKNLQIDTALVAEKGSLLPSGLSGDGNLMYFAGKRLAILTSNNPSHNLREPFSVDMLILTQNINVRIPQIIESYSPDMIVIDASNSQARINRWEKECEEAGVKYHRVDRDGAFILND